MLTKNERMEKLNKAGINTSKYFSVDLDNGTKIHLIIDENGNCTQVKNDPIAEQIIADGYVRNTKLHRRFVMAQMFHMLNYVSYDGLYRGYTACLNKTYSYNYTLTMMLDEIKVLSKLETRDKESFDERSHFFTKDVVVKVLEDYLTKLEAYINGLPDKNCKGVPYKRVKGVNIFNADLDKKIYAPMRSIIYRIKWARDYDIIYKELCRFMNKKTFIKLPYNTTKSKVWVDTYKGEGAFYTCKNLIMFHDCKVQARYCFYTRDESIAILNQKLNEYYGEGWRMFAFMKKLIKDNGFDFSAKMKEIYNK